MLYLSPDYKFAGSSAGAGGLCPSGWWAKARQAGGLCPLVRNISFYNLIISLNYFHFMQIDRLNFGNQSQIAST